MIDAGETTEHKSSCGHLCNEQLPGGAGEKKIRAPTKMDVKGKSKRCSTGENTRENDRDHPRAPTQKVPRTRKTSERQEGGGRHPESSGGAEKTNPDGGPLGRNRPRDQSIQNKTTKGKRGGPDMEHHSDPQIIGPGRGFVKTVEEKKRCKKTWWERSAQKARPTRP